MLALEMVVARLMGVQNDRLKKLGSGGKDRKHYVKLKEVAFAEGEPLRDIKLISQYIKWTKIEVEV